MDEDEEEELAEKNENLAQMAAFDELDRQKDGTEVSGQSSVFSFQKKDQKESEVSLSTRLSLLKQARQQ